MSPTAQTETLVRNFLEIVRSGKEPSRAGEFLADSIIAHQLNAEKQEIVHRTPKNYQEHIEEFLTLFGNFSFEITELIVNGDKAYARWVQSGKHLAPIGQYQPTELPLVEIGSAVYRVEGGKIVEYWIQPDRLGMEKQLAENSKKAIQ